ncbi:uncharacterized protein [Ptychodera flava]|uniref:uncharacterized protein n=1 Tax=Ptychodera flava TaxID=63121 RepID=UPI00396AAE68
MWLSKVLVFAATFILQKASASDRTLLFRDTHETGSRTVIGVTTDKEMVVLGQDGEWSDPIENSCCVVSVAVQLGGIVVGVGVDNQLYEWKSKGGEWSWVGPTENSCCVISIAASYGGRLLGITTDNKVAIKKSSSSPWIKIPDSCCFQSVEILRDGRLFAVTLYGKVKSKVDMATGEWQKLSIDGPEIRTVIYLDELGISVALSKDGCEMYKLDDEKMEWGPNINVLGEPCLISMADGLEPELIT